MRLHGKLLELVNGLRLKVIRRELCPRPEQLSQRMHHLRVARARMRADVVHRAKEGLQVLQGPDGRPLANCFAKCGVRAPPFFPHELPDQLDFLLGQLELLEPKTEREG